jgi:O-antigen/teichoic acid export membrane protein
MTRRLVTNAAALLSSEVVQRAATFLIYLLVARYLDEAAFGRLSLALTLLYVAQVTGGFGLRTYVARTVANDRAAAADHLLHGSAVALVASLATVAALATFVAAAGYAADTATVVLILALAAVPFAIGSVAEGLFVAFERMHLVAWVNAPLQVVRVVGTLLLLGAGADLVPIVVLWVGVQLAILVGQLALATRLVRADGGRAAFALRPAAAIARGSATFMAIDATIAVWSSVPVVLLSVLRSEVDAGRFNAAAQLMVPVMLVLQSATSAVLPTMARRFAEGAGGLRRVAAGTLEALLSLAWPAAVGLFVIAPAVLRWVYGDASFDSAAVALRVLVVGLLFRAVTATLGQVLLAGLQERVTLRIVAVNAVVVLVLALVLVPPFGVTGAAVAVTVAGALNMAQHYAPAARMVGALPLWAVSWRPAAAALVMAAVLTAVAPDAVPVSIALGALVYGVALAGLRLLPMPGPGGSSARRWLGWRRS